MDDTARVSEEASAGLGIALGGGAALGLAHIGVLRVLQENGLHPRIVAGTSIGALVGAAYVFGVLDRLENAARNVGWREVMRLSDVKISKSGLLGGDAIVKEIKTYVGEVTFEAAAKPFAVVASDLATNEEVLLRNGSVASALRASISVPGVFTPVLTDGRVLVDGGLKNPIPVSVCRDLGATTVISVDVTGDYDGLAADAGMGRGQPFTGGLYEIATMSMAMIMNQIARVNARISPADVAIVPRIGHMKPYEFREGAALIEAGREAAEAALPDIRRALGIAA